MQHELSLTFRYLSCDLYNLSRLNVQAFFAKNDSRHAHTAIGTGFVCLTEFCLYSATADLIGGLFISSKVAVLFFGYASKLFCDFQPKKTKSSFFFI